MDGDLISRNKVIEVLKETAELIDKGALVEKLKRTSVFECVRNSADKNVFEIIGDMPTTTEAEIRAKAITAMSKAMKEYYPSCKGAYVDFDVFFHAVMAKVAEQMEEGADNGK